MLFPNAHDLWHCLSGGYEFHWPTMAIFVMRWVVSICYVLIAIKWLRDLADSAISVLLCGIFIACMLCGYALPNVAAWCPDAAYTTTLAALLALAMVCVGFLWFTRGKQIVPVDKAAANTKIGNAIRAIEVEQRISVTDVDNGILEAIRRELKEAQEIIRNEVNSPT